VDYLYVDANEGGSSGGHTALRLGGEVYHYQYESPGMLRLEAEPADGFEARYRLLENRTIRVSRIPVDDDTFALLLEEFSRRRAAEETQRACLASLHARARLLEAIVAARRGERSGVPVAGAGFFVDRTPAESSDGVEPALLALRARVADAYGAGFLDLRVGALRGEMAALPVAGGPEPSEPTMVDRVSCQGAASQWEDDAAGLMALIALREARPLAPDAVISLAATLGANERLHVAEITDALRERLMQLVRASHPGWGFALVVGLARLAALERTLATGQWHVLDAYPPDARRLESARVAHRRETLRELEAIAAADLADARRELVEAPPSELALARVEATGNRLVELERALESGASLRLLAGPLLPVRPATWQQPEAAATNAVVAAALEAAHRRERRFARAFASLHAYDLIRRNCVTELFRTIEEGVARVTPPGTPIETELTRRLGGAVRVDGSLVFIPFLSAAAVEADLQVAETTELPSYRRAQLARLEATNGRWRMWLREGNTLTSTLYRRNPDDSFFVFFTDDTLALRPVLGAVNLVAAFGSSIAGLVTLPLDHGERLGAGLRGALFSLPELAFVNIRKGSFTYVHTR